MKKLIVMLLTVVLLASATGGYAYALTEHQPMVGQKLVGVGTLGIFYDLDSEHDTLVYSRCLIMNPDCVGVVTNICIRIISDTGTEYSGKLLSPLTSPQEVTALAPHQSGVVDVISCVFPELTDPYQLQTAAYTIELSWTGTKSALPLVGWIWLATATFDGTTTPPTFVENISTSAMTQMVNMTQVLTKNK